jgi:hypothetical protein
MGWTGIYTKGLANTEEVNRIVKNEVSSLDVLRIERNRGEYYIAYKSRNSGKVEGLVVITERTPGQVTYKDMHEECMPYYFGASKKLVGMLSPTDSEYANEWRQECIKVSNNVEVII